MNTDICSSVKSLIGLSVVVALAASAHAAPTYTIHAPNGVGDVVALTNVLATMETDGASLGLRLWLEPGVYDLRGIKMENGSHLYVRHTRDAVIAGLGQTPGDTVLLGGGETDKCRVAYIVGGGNYWSTTVSNLTVTGGYADNANGGGIRAGNTSVLYDTCIISNNVSTATATTNNTKQDGGGGCYNGRARNCLFADNRTTGSGGGLSSTHRNGSNQTYTPVSIVDCVFTNNKQTATCYAIIWQGATYGGGGGAACVPGGTIVSGSQFIGNYSRYRGGAIALNGGSCAVSDCTFIGNLATNSYIRGGAIFGGIAATNCTFIGNQANDGGGAIYVPASPSRGSVVGCRFFDNKTTVWGTGGGIMTLDNVPYAQVFDSVFSGNSASTGNGDAAYNSDLFDCVVTNHVGTVKVLVNCNLTRCRVRDNRLGSTWASAIDAGSGTHTNVNCEFAFNTSDSMAWVSYKKVNINCTFIGNRLGGGNYAFIVDAGKSFNCIFAENKIGGTMLDARTHDIDNAHTVVMTNCLFNKTDKYVSIDQNGYATYDGMGNCRQVADMKLETNAFGDHVPMVRSRANNAGLASDWILSAVGDTDLAGNRRVFADGLDIGALECQHYPPGLILTVH